MKRHRAHPFLIGRPAEATLHGKEASKLTQAFLHDGADSNGGRGRGFKTAPDRSNRRKKTTEIESLGARTENENPTENRGTTPPCLIEDKVEKKNGEEMCVWLHSPCAFFCPHTTFPHTPVLASFPPFLIRRRPLPTTPHVDTDILHTDEHIQPHTHTKYVHIHRRISTPSRSTQILVRT